ncbi:Copia proteinlike [Phytophthora palmivora]|uniref:Copia proteinlike n=1 Tax=Phytophthora palmivora TaxID=4796 RepID=A0A2P4X138_9STRA|nr:Copia proteinlike [Phytophthora palmivora]
MTAADIRNVLPNTSNQHSTYVPNQQRKKLDDTAVKCGFLGYTMQRKVYRLLKVSDGPIVISRSVTFTEAPIVKVPRDCMEGVFDIADDDEDEDINNEAGAEEGFRTPPTRPRQEPAHEEHDGPSHSVPMRGSSTPGRDGEEEWMVRPVRKRRGVVRYEQEFSNLRRGQFNLDDFEADHDSLYGVHAEDDDGERAVTYDEVMKSKYNDEWLRAMESDEVAGGPPDLDPR